MKKLRILQLFSDENWTGPAEPVLNLSKELIKRGHQVHFACARRKGKLKGRVEAAGVPLVNSLHLDRYCNPVNDIHDLFVLPRILKAYQVDIIHMNFSHDHTIVALSVGWGRKRPFLVRTVHRAVPYTGPFEKSLYHIRADRIITVCQSARRKIISNVGSDKSKVSVIYGAVDIKKFNPDNTGDKIRTDLGLTMETPIVGMVAPLQSHRGHARLFAAVPRIKSAVPGTKFILMGNGGSYQSSLEKLARQLNIENDIIYAGYREDDFPSLLAAIDVKVFLAAGSDGSCRAVLETMATGKPIVSVPVGPIADITPDEFPGFIINPENKDSLAESIITLLTNKSLAETKGAQGRKLAETRFREGIRADKVEAVYRSLFNKGKYERRKHLDRIKVK